MNNKYFHNIAISLLLVRSISDKFRHTVVYLYLIIGFFVKLFLPDDIPMLKCWIDQIDFYNWLHIRVWKLTIVDCNHEFKCYLKTSHKYESYYHVKPFFQEGFHSLSSSKRPFSYFLREIAVAETDKNKRNFIFGSFTISETH